jgi:hypothetical protein
MITILLAAAVAAPAPEQRGAVLRELTGGIELIPQQTWDLVSCTPATESEKDALLSRLSRDRHLDGVRVLWIFSEGWLRVWVHPAADRQQRHRVSELVDWSTMTTNNSLFSGCPAVPVILRGEPLPPPKGADR